VGIGTHRAAAAVQPSVHLADGSTWKRTADYLSATETHALAFSIAAQALLSFFPFLVLLLTLMRNVLHSPRLYRGLLMLLESYLPVSDAPGEQSRTYIIQSLQRIVEHHAHAQLLSLLVLLATCTGIFLPLEVALNRIWEAKKNRSYWANWMISFGLAFSCGILGLLSASLTALSETYSTRLARYLMRHSLIHVAHLRDAIDLVSVLLTRAGAVPVTIAAFFLIYWVLPNVRVPARRILPVAITAGLLWETSKYLYILLQPKLNFRDLYGPFALSVSLLLWAWVSALILLGVLRILTIPTVAADAESAISHRAEGTPAFNRPAGAPPASPADRTVSVLDGSSH
jgi:membrane protein